MAVMNKADALSRIFSHVIQKKKSTTRTRKTAAEYAMEYSADLISKAVVRDGQVTDVLYCKFCCQSISSRSDRIKEHVKCKKHLMIKSKVIQAAIDGKTLSEENREEVVRMVISGPPKEKKPLRQLRQPVVKDNKKKSESVIFHKAEDESKKEETVLNNTVTVEAATSSENLETGVTIVDCKPEVSDSKSQLENANNKGEQLLCVRWDNYDANAIQMFAKLKELGTFIDVTLWCEGTSIKCHKIILSSCSTFFESILAETANHNNMYPIIILTELRLWQVQALVHFMYNGEMSINREDLESLLHAASALGIKGLSPSSNDGDTVK